ncbi:IS481 family transposase [Hypericibacter adhaerens]|uniref:IS481 family transposase n=1 Tax=Hypericibacter adhaerens TaxID=2602016 RepID=UPI0012471D90|nr:IS481 family transposase [Hypericibacter adhaerens]
MPWGSALDRRVEFVRLAQAPGCNFSELCRRFGVSRSDGYKWLRRFEAEGAPGLQERSRRPRSSPGRTPGELEAEVLAVRAEHPAWGGRKIRKVLQREGRDAPAASTVTAILRRHGKLDGPGAGEARDWVRFEHEAPNDLWQMDFKGHFALGTGRCHPLTVLDDHSRYALAIGACGDERETTVRERLTGVFRRYGLPLRLLADNGAPWGTAGPERHTRLTVWLMDLGVGVCHGRPYHPQTQGKDERFHRTLKAELLDRWPLQDLAGAQAAFDHWREVYNAKRPHEALGLEPPASRYRMSPRPMPERIDPPEYEPQAQLRKVHDTGWISFKGRQINCSKAFVGRRLALRATTTDGVFDLCYRSHVLSQVDLRQHITHTVLDVPERVSSMSPV